MRFGVCGDLEMAKIAVGSAYDFTEWNVGGLLKPREPENIFLATLEEVRIAKLPYSVLNCFVPADLKITGDDVDFSALRDYVTITMKRAEQAGIETIVFGSGGARRVPDGFDRKTAREQIVFFCSMTAPIAHNHGVTVVVEPLNKEECNILTTVSESASIVKEVAHPGLKLLVDAYHLMRNNDLYEDIITYGNLLSHVHIATVENRLAPGAEPCDFVPFFNALVKAEYKGNVSIEGNIINPEVDLITARNLMVKLSETNPDE